MIEETKQDVIEVKTVPTLQSNKEETTIHDEKTQPDQTQTQSFQIPQGKPSLSLN